MLRPCLRDVQLASRRFDVRHLLGHLLAPARAPARHHLTDEERPLRPGARGHRPGRGGHDYEATTEESLPGSLVPEVEALPWSGYCQTGAELPVHRANPRLRERRHRAIGGAAPKATLDRRGARRPGAGRPSPGRGGGCAIRRRGDWPGLADGRSPSDLAVLYRLNAQSQAPEEALREVGIRHRVRGGPAFFDRAEVRDVLAWLKICAYPDDDVSLARIANMPPRGIGDVAMGRLGEWAASAGRPMATSLATAAQVPLRCRTAPPPSPCAEPRTPDPFRASSSGSSGRPAGQLPSDIGGSV